MRRVEPLAEADMVAAFLRAELHSERFGERLRAAARRLAVPLEAIERPDTSDPHQNAQRLDVLRDYRRYGKTSSLFDGFPYAGVSWSRCALSPDEVLAIRYIDDAYWRDLSGGTRLPAHAARRIRGGQANPEHARNFLRIADALAAGAAFHEMIAVSAGPDTPLVALEGHLRLTVYALQPDRIPNPLTIVLGASPRMPEWGCY